MKHYFAGQSLPEEASSKGAFEDSFRIDLPPASQLDHSVLEALPPHIRQKVLQGYANRGLPVDEKTSTADPIDPNAMKNERKLVEKEQSAMQAKIDKEAILSSDSEEIVICDEKRYLSAWKEYISGWCGSFPQGPNDSDVSKVSNYLCRLARTNLEVTELCLKSFRRLVEARCSSSECCWCISFDAVLHGVQEKVRENYSGCLNIKPFNYKC